MSSNKAQSSTNHSTAYNRSKDIRRNLLSSTSNQTSSLPSTLHVTHIISARVRELQQFNTSTTTITGTKRIYQCLVRHKRRRAMSHDVKLIPKTLRAAGYREMIKHIESGGLPPSKKIYRNIRRSKKMVLLNKLYRANKHKWLEIHHFLSKRTKMANQWGYRLPLYTNDKCDRAIEKFQNVKCTISDESYLTPIEITSNTTSLIWLITSLGNYFNTYTEHLAQRTSTNEPPTPSKTAQNTFDSNTSSSTPSISRTSSYTSNKYALERLKKEVFSASSLASQSGTLEIAQTLRYPSYSSLIFIAKQQYPTLSTQDVENSMKTTLAWINQADPTISNLSNTIIAPIRIQWIQSPSRLTSSPLLSTYWLWVHPSSTQLIYNICNDLLNFFSTLFNQLHSTSITYPHIITILSNQFSRYSLRGPKSTLSLSRILQLSTSTPSPAELIHENDGKMLDNHEIWSKLTQLQTAPTNILRPDTILTIHVMNPENSILSNNPTTALSGQSMSTKLLTKTNKYSLDKGLSVLSMVSTKSASFSSNHFASSTQSLTSPAPFYNAGNGMISMTSHTTAENIQDSKSQKKNFIPATWTHSLSTSHPSRYTPPIEINTTTSPRLPENLNQNETPTLSIFSPLDRSILIEQSPGNIASLKCLKRRNVDMFLTSSGSQTTVPSVQPTVPIIIIIRGNSTPTSSSSVAQTTPNNQTGYDIIVPRGWGRSFALNLLKKAGAILVGKNQRNVLNLESGAQIDAFPHPATFPNSFAVQSVLRMKRIQKIVELCRRKRKNGHTFTKFGLLGPNFNALFNQQSSNSINMSSMNDIIPNNDQTCSVTDVLQINPIQQLALLYRIRHWLSQLVRYTRAKQRKLRRKRRDSIPNIFNDSTNTKNTKNITKEKKINPLQQTKQKNRFPCPISSLDTFHSSQLPTCDIESYKHASTKRSLSFLLKHTTLTPIDQNKVVLLLSSPFSPYFIPPITWLHKRTYQAQALLKPIQPMTCAQKKNQKTKNANNTQKSLIGGIIADTTDMKSNYPQHISKEIQTIQKAPKVGLLHQQGKKLNKTSQQHYKLNPYDVIDLAEFNADYFIDNTSLVDRTQDTAPKILCQPLALFNPTSFNVFNNIMYQFPILLNTIAPSSNNLSSYFSKPSSSSNTTQQPQPIPQTPPSFSFASNQFVNFLSTTLPVLSASSQPLDEKLSVFSSILLYSILTSYLDPSFSPQSHSTKNILIPLRLDQLSKGQIVQIEKNDKSGVGGQTGVIVAPSAANLHTIYRNLVSKKALKRSLRSLQTSTINSVENTLTDTSINNVENENIDQLQPCDQKNPNAIGFSTFSHTSIRSGYPYAFGFITAHGLLQVLQDVLDMMKYTPNPSQICQVIDFIITSQNPLPFCLSSIKFPVAIYTENNEKLAWAKVNSF